MGNIFYIKPQVIKNISSGDICWQWVYGLNKSKSSYVIINNTIKQDKDNFKNMWKEKDDNAISITYTFDINSNNFNTTKVDNLEDANNLTYAAKLPFIFKQYFNKVKEIDLAYNQMTINWFEVPVEYKIDRYVKSICIFYENTDDHQTLSFEPIFDNKDFMYDLLELSINNGSIISICGDTNKNFNYNLKPHVSKDKIIILSFKQIKITSPTNITEIIS